jgi:hypothetical protein
MQEGTSIGVNQGFKERKRTSPGDSIIGIEENVSSFRQFINKGKEILVALLLYAILLSAALQSLFRDQLLAWMKEILERTY